MKKLSLLLSALALTALLCACGGTDTPALSPVPTDDSTEQTVDSGSCYSIVEEYANGSTKYHYTVTAKDGTVIEDALASKQPKTAMRTDTLLRMLFVTDDNNYYCRYYDIASGKTAGSYADIFWDNGVYCAGKSYDDGHYLIVRSIFGDSYYESTKIDCSSWQFQVLSAELNDDGTVLTVTYIPGDGTDSGYSKQTVKLSIPAE